MAYSRIDVFASRAEPFDKLRANGKFSQEQRFSAHAELVEAWRF
jgi:hypothetical protein